MGTPSTGIVSALLPVSGDPPVKPRLRGFLHQWAFVVSLVSGSVLVALAPAGRPRLAASIYSLSVTLLFGTSALYHRRTWAPRPRSLMKRLDHAMILVLIAGSYTPIAMLLLPRSTGRWMLWTVWVGAALGVIVRMLWLRAPRWAALPPYLLVGAVALLALPPLLRHGGVAALVLMLSGGLIYVVGAVIYAIKRPDPRPAVFGYHELFHLLTLVAGAAMYIVNSMAVYGV
jgi:hemolysin III